MSIDWTLLAFVAAAFIAAMSGAVFKPGEWYERLAKPSWNPPNWLFPIAWTPLFGMIATAGWWAYESGGGFAGAPLAMGVYFLQLVLNAGWSAVFFGLKRPDLGLVEVGALWLSIAATTVLFFQIDATAGWLFVPYLVWTTFAARLNLKIVQLNPSERGRTA